MASNSSMKPIAPPSSRAALRTDRKNDRILRLVWPKYMDWKALADTKRNGTPASPDMALARYVFPVPGGPSNRTPRRGWPPISVANVVWARNRLRVSTASRLVASAPTTSLRRMPVSAGRSTT